MWTSELHFPGSSYRFMGSPKMSFFSVNAEVKDAIEVETGAAIVETECGNMVVPNMATTTSSLMTCTEPREMKKRESRMSP